MSARSWLWVALAALTSLAASRAEAQPFRFPSTCGPGCAGWITYYDEGGRDWACGRRYYGGHFGTDYAMARGRDIVASAPGTVTRTVDGCRDNCVLADGCTCTNMVTIVHDSGTTTEYLHMMRGSVAVSRGQRVDCGQHIGRVASSGRSSGPHLHFHFWLAGSSWSHRLDPFSGPCSGQPSRWVDQGGYLGIPSMRCFTDADGDGSPADVDCDDHNPRRRPGRAEACDAEENDCDARIDENLVRECGTDVGECEIGSETCAVGVWGECVGDVPPVAEVCDTLDNDCDGATDQDRVCEYDDAALGAILGSRAHSDVDGDGRIDACMRSTEGLECVLGTAVGFGDVVRGPPLRDDDGWDVPATYTSLRMDDVDGDGRDDVCVRTSDRVVCWGASGRGFDETIVTLPVGMPSDPRSAQLWLADVDGDGRADPCVRDEAGLRCQPREGASLVLRALSDEAGWGDVARHGTIRFGDVDGDARDDVCARDAEGVSCWLADERGFSRRLTGPPWSDARGWGETQYWSTLRVVDVDGDDRADLCARGPDGFVCSLAEPGGFGPLHRGPPMGAGWEARAAYATVRMGDVDGDGTSDVCARSGGWLSCWLWGGESFDRQIRGPELSDADGWDQSLRYGSLRLADVDADGRADVCARDDEGVICWISTGAGFSTVRRAGRWTDADGVAAPSYLSSLTIAGSVSPTSTAGCGCTAGRPGDPGGLAVIGGATLGVLVVRLRRRRSGRGS